MKAIELPSLSGAQIQSLEFAYQRSPDQDSTAPVRHVAVIVGAGPVGLTLAIDLAQRGQKVVLLDSDNKVSTGSRAICFAKRTLEIWNRLGVGDRMCAKGVSWNVGKVFLRNALLYRFDLLPEAGHERPAFINLQQYYAEAFLIERAASLPNLEIRWCNNVVAVEPGGGGVALGIDTPDGNYRLDADWLIACDGSRSAVRGLIGDEAQGHLFRDRFLIADVRIRDAAFPPERWFWFDPPFHRNQSALLHMQPDGVWRIDFQLGWNADPEEEKKPENIIPRVRALLQAAAVSKKGVERSTPAVEFDLVWASVYTFSCLRMRRFRHGRVLFAGDAAHCVSPFGARGANSGVQDADNLGWKLDLVLRGQAGDSLLDSYAAERESAADENIAASTRSTDFITPKSEISRLFRDSALELARDHAFARQLVNSGRLSVPAILRESPLDTPDVDVWGGAVVPGAVACDAPLRLNGNAVWLLRHLGTGFTLLVFGAEPPWAAGLAVTTIRLDTANDPQGLLVRRYDLRSGNAVLFRPDQHVCARWRNPSEDAVRAALARAMALQ